MDNYYRAPIAPAVSTVPAWWELAWEAVPIERVDGGYLKVTRAGSNQDDVNIVWVGAAGGAIGASQVRRDMQGGTRPQNEAGRSEDGAKNPDEKVQSLARATYPCQQREMRAAAMQGISLYGTRPCTALKTPLLPPNSTHRLTPPAPYIPPIPSAAKVRINFFMWKSN